MSLDAVTNHSKGYCFIEFDEPAAAEAAITAMDGFELGGRKIKVGRPSRGDGSMPTPFSVSFNPLSGQVH